MNIHDTGFGSVAGGNEVGSGGGGGGLGSCPSRKIPLCLLSAALLDSVSRPVYEICDIVSALLVGDDGRQSGWICFKREKEKERKKENGRCGEKLEL